jgi:TolC family type I secretion outer membrane protein
LHGISLDKLYLKSVNRLKLFCFISAFLSLSFIFAAAFFMTTLNFNSAAYAINTSANINTDINSNINAELYTDSNTNNNNSSSNTEHSNSNNSKNISRNNTKAKARKNQNTSNLAPFPLNLVEAYKDALKYDRGYKAALYGKRASNALGWEGLSVLLPHVSAQVDVSRYDFLNPPPYYLSFTSTTKEINLSLPIFSLRRIFEYAQYKTRQAVGDMKYRSEKQDLLIRVAEAYLDVLAAQNYIGVLNSQKQTLKEELKQEEKLYKAGDGTITDVYDAKSKYYYVLSELIGAKNQLESAYIKFKDTVGVSGKNIEHFKKKMPLYVPFPHSVKYWMNIGIKHNPMLKYYKYSLNYQQEEVKKAISEHLPSVSFQAGYEDTNTQELIQTPALRDWNIGFQLNIPIFNGGYAFAKTAEASNKAMASKEEYEKEVYKNDRKISQSYLGIKGDIVKIKMLELAVKSAHISLKGNRLGFKSGIKTMTDVLNAVQRLYNARVKLLKAKYGYVMNLLGLYFNAGILSKYELAKINRWLD